jgi:hypothetical protein
MTDPDWPYIQITFALDETTQNFERRVQTLSFAMSIIGGLLGLVTSIIIVGMGWIQEQLFYSSIMKKIFFH